MYKCALILYWDYDILHGSKLPTLFTADTSLETLLQNEQATQIMEQYIKGAVAETERNDVETMSKSLNEMKAKSALFGMTLDNFEKAIAEIGSIQA